MVTLIPFRSLEPLQRLRDFCDLDSMGKDLELLKRIIFTHQFVRPENEITNEKNTSSIWLIESSFTYECTTIAQPRTRFSTETGNSVVINSTIALVGQQTMPAPFNHWHSRWLNCSCWLIHGRHQQTVGWLELLEWSSIVTNLQGKKIRRYDEEWRQDVD